MSETRKLVAILVADVVGYSRLADADEDLTLARLRALRSDLIDPPQSGNLVVHAFAKTDAFDLLAALPLPNANLSDFCHADSASKTLPRALGGLL